MRFKYDREISGRSHVILEGKSIPGGLVSFNLGVAERLWAELGASIKACQMDRCACTFVKKGEPMQANGCEIHIEDAYKCDECACSNYRPRRRPDVANGIWPGCVCGHAAQSHN